MRLRLFSLLLITEITHVSTGSAEVCSTLPPTPRFAKPLNITNVGENMTRRYSCTSGYVRKAGTSSLIRCIRNKQMNLQWSEPQLECIRDPKSEFLKEPSTAHKTTTPYFSGSLSVSPNPTPTDPLTYQTTDPVTETTPNVAPVTATTTAVDDITSVPVDTTSSAPTTIPMTSVSPSENPVVSQPSPQGFSIEKSISLGSVLLIMLILTVIAMLIWRKKRLKRHTLSPKPEEQRMMTVNGTNSTMGATP
ncbi:hypothetical protein DPEC_G00112540 [Dallia pectoralis]|uniref:Uncharacterized protein n=1 Tax=Dallia pectoralis TaxID=75939 RepID=A0ACC2GTT3_DALPE|nr:hypothetical protein DPEC_G00112540 [Dallia pectoralis]